MGGDLGGANIITTLLFFLVTILYIYIYIFVIFTRVCVVYVVKKVGSFRGTQSINGCGM